MIQLVREHTILAVVVGSRAYGLDGPGSDGACPRTGQTNHKQAMHMIRLLHAGAHVLRTGEVLVDVAHLRDRLLAVRSRDLPWERVAGWAAELLADLATAAAEPPLPDGAAQHLAADIPRLRAELETARDTSPLPEQPDPADVGALHDLVVRTRLHSTISHAT
jgi:hypothetical protein